MKPQVTIKPPIIVLEGPDAAGKTTLAAYLTRALSGARFRATWTPALNLAMIDYQRSILDNAKEHIAAFNTPYILDRHWPSEWVYGQVFRSLSDCQFEAMVQFDDEIKQLGGIYIFCSDDAATQVIRHERCKNPTHAYDKESYLKILSRYFVWWKLMDKRSPIVRYRMIVDGRNIGQFVHDLLSDYTDRILYRDKLVRPVTIEELQK